MNGKITINGYYRNEDYELICTGAGADPDALCSLTYDYSRIEEVLDLLHMMKESLQQSLDAERFQKEIETKKAKVNSILLRQGHPGLSDEALNEIINVCFCPAAECFDRSEQASMN
ncbi:MAG: hypothetical protein GXX00_08115 [Hungateiclostridium thermocellum]|nr:hypothetical protein [Acetivibrio thermocellus]